MNSTQRSSRYSSAENSGYEDDFEVDGDDLDGDLELDGGQAEEDDASGLNIANAAEGDTPSGGATGSYDGADGDDGEGRYGSPEVPLGGSQTSADQDLNPARTLFHRDDTDDPDGSPSAHGRASHGGSAAGSGTGPSGTPVIANLPAPSPRDEPLAGSPASPPVPPLPPLTAAVSPYLARGGAHAAGAAGAEAATTAASNLPLPPRLPPSYPQQSSAAASTSSSVAAGHTAAPAAATATRPTTSRGAVAPGAHAASGSRPAATPGQRTPGPTQIGRQPQSRLASPGYAAAGGGASTDASAMPALALALLQQATNSGVQQQHDLAAAISQSVDVMRASEHVRQLQATVEALTGQLLASERARSAAEAALVELTQRMQEQERRLNETWEAKVLEKQREVQQLRSKVQQLEAQGIKGRLAAATGSGTTRGSQHGVGGGASSSSGGGASISPEEAGALRKELEQTELLIRGYQQENEAATRRIKELEETLASSEARAAEEVLRTERAVLLARDDVGRRNAEAATKLARVLALEKELAGVREEAQTREAELKAQIEKLRAEKKALEARSGGVDLKAMAEGDVLVKQLREEMEAGRQATQALIQEMQAKLAWYAENQELLNKNDALLAEQRETIGQLQARLMQYEGTGGATKGGPAANRVAAAQARVRELEAQVDQLQKALRSRAPANSLAAVVAAARPTAEESQLVLELRARVEGLEDDLRHKDEEFELQLRAYQQQFEKLKAQYSERAGRLEAVTKVRGRVKDLERQLEEQKGIFGRRVRELEAKLKAAQDHGAVIPPTPAAMAPPYPTAGGTASAFQTPTKGHQGHAAQGQGQAGQAPPSAAGAAGRRDDLVPASYLRARELEVKKLQAELDRKSKQVSELHLKLGETESRIVRLTADLRRAQANGGGAGQSPLPARNRHDGLSHEDRPVGPSRGARQQLDPYPPDGSGHRGSDSGEGSGGGGGQRHVSAELLERLEERCSNLTVENGNLRGQVQALTRQLTELRQELEGARAAAAARPAASAESQALVADLRRKLEAAELALVTVQRSTTEAVERGALAAAEHQRSMLRLHDEVVYKEGLKWQERLATLEQELRTAQQRCEQMEAELAVARSRGAGSWSPEASAFSAMERRLDDMARDMATREAKWRAVLQDTQSLHSVQSDIQKKKWESALAAKEAEVQATRAELQSLLQEVAQVQELQTRVVAKQQRQAARGTHQE